MKRNFFISCFFLLSSSAWAERWVVNTLEWPPYTCSRCPENGAAAKALREAMKKVGVDVEFVFYPWTQAMQKGADPNVVGYYPLWKESLKPGFVISPVLFQSPLGFIEPRNKPLKWTSLSDLRGKKIGVTKDYGNTVEFNGLIEKGLIKAEVAASDDINIQRVGEGKLDGALMDINNARYFLFEANPEALPRVSVNSKILETKDLYFAFNDKNVAKMKKLKSALQKVNFQRLVDDYLVTYPSKGD